MATYDYIIVGAGSAGGVLAARLSEDADVSVLLLEAGSSKKSIYMTMPLAYRRILGDKRFNWSYRSEPEPHLGGRRIEIPRGRTLGGSSAINGMLYLRGHPRDYDLWRQAGCEGWSYADVLPYFRRAEGSWRGEGAYHGGDGPLGVTAIDTAPLRHDDVREAAASVGLPLTVDFCGVVPEGFGICDATVKDGRRMSTRRAYLEPAMTRANLTVISEALTQRVVLENGRAVGVAYRRRGEEVVARAEREVILSAGSYNSPQILMLSGIGPADEIAAQGITPHHDLAGVGANLTEHVIVRVRFRTRRPDTHLRRLRLDRLAMSAARWGLFKTGDIANQPLAAMAFVRTLPELERPDLQLFFSALRIDARPWFPGLAEPLAHLLDNMASVMHPESRGTVRLASASPAEPPRIQLNLLSAEEDVAALRRGIRLLREIHAAGPLAARVAEEVEPGAAVESDEALDAHIRSAASIGHHPVGTCAMGSSPDSVVDPELRVRGIDGLRVVDASVMPTVPGGNTNAPTIMIAERAADLIRGRPTLAPETPVA